MIFVWIIASVVFFIIELATVQLATVWFVFGALAALLAAFLGAPLWLQITLFILVSVLLLIFTRPLAKKWLFRNKEATNSDRCIGRQAAVTEEIDNNAGTGAVRVLGLTWTARSADGAVIPAGRTVTVIRIEGVKLIVERK